MELNLNLFVPELFLAASGIFMIVLDFLVPTRAKNRTFALLTALAGAVAVFLVVLFTPFSPEEAFNGFIKKDYLALLSQVLILFTLLLTVLVSYDYLKKFETKYPGEFYYTLLFATVDAMLMVEANEPSTLFVSLEVTSISIYVLMALFRGDYRGKEGALKYFILGSVGAGVMAYGFAVVYGLTGTTLYPEIAYSISNSSPLLLLLAVAFILSGFLFKWGVFPFHPWVPDAYQGAPTPVTLFMGAVMKVAAFVALVRLFLPAFLSLSPHWQEPVLIFAVLSALFGALAALNQENLKRMLAYSSISHGGVILAALASYPAVSVFSVLFYLFAYAFMTVASFGLISLLTVKGYRGESLSDWKGLYQRAPFLALLSVVVFMSLAGIPPLLGFWAKFYVLIALVESGQVLVALAILLASLISLGFYLKPLVYAFMKEGGEKREELGFSAYAAVVVSAFFLVLLGLFPELLSQLFLLGVASFLKGVV